MTDTQPPVQVDIYEQLKVAKAHTKELADKVHERERINDLVLNNAETVLNENWNKTHCIDANNVCIWVTTFAGITFGIVVLVVVIFAGVYQAIDLPGNFVALLIFALGLPWMALVACGFNHMPVCAHHDACGCCRRCPCSK